MRDSKTGKGGESPAVSLHWTCGVVRLIGWHRQKQSKVSIVACSYDKKYPYFVEINRGLQGKNISESNMIGELAEWEWGTTVRLFFQRTPEGSGCLINGNVPPCCMKV